MGDCVSDSTVWRERRFKRGGEHLGTAHSMNNSRAAMCVFNAASRKVYVMKSRSSKMMRRSVLQQAPKMTQKSL